jgi:hypothetical protein
VQKRSIRKITALQYFVTIVHFISISIFLFTCCVKYAKYVPDPVKDIDQWVENFSQQRSFSYDYEMKTTLVKVGASGDCVIGVGERLSGQWERDGDVQEFMYIGLGDLEYMRRGNDWEVSSRGEESDVFTQITRLFSFDKFEYKVSDRGYLYQFRANIPFLAPDRRKEMIGHVRISDRNYLPDFIWAGLPDSSIYWTACINNYNVQKSIKAPIAEYRDYQILFEGTNARNIEGAIKQRLELSNVQYREKLVMDGLLISLPVQYQIEDAERLLRPGGLVVYGVVEQGRDAQRTAYLKDNLYEPVFLSERLFDESTVRDVEIKFDQRSTPYIEIRLRDRRRMPAAIAFEIDSMLVATATLDTLYKMDRIRLYPDMQYREMEILQAYIKQPLGAIKISPAGGENP